jgi:hypothetical protein
VLLLSLLLLSLLLLSLLLLLLSLLSLLLLLLSLLSLLSLLLLLLSLLLLRIVLRIAWIFAKSLTCTRIDHIVRLLQNCSKGLPPRAWLLSLFLHQADRTVRAERNANILREVALDPRLELRPPSCQLLRSVAIQLLLLCCCCCCCCSSSSFSPCSSYCCCCHRWRRR